MLREDRRVYSRLSLARSSLQCLEVITLLACLPDRSLALRIIIVALTFLLILMYG